LTKRAASKPPFFLEHSPWQRGTNYLTKPRTQIDRQFDYRYSILVFVFSDLIRQGRLSEQEPHGLSEDKLASVRQYAESYDAIYELTGVTQGSTTTESYTYDPVGNRLSSLGVSPYNARYYDPSAGRFPSEDVCC
jgi:YD repeat-containing protein